MGSLLNGAAALPFGGIYGVDFSGARRAGRNTWAARRGPRRRRPAHRPPGLARLETLRGTAERGAALAHLVARITASDAARWALDSPFGLPVEVMRPGTRWAGQFAFLGEWGEDAYGAGVECVRRALARGGAMHIRRLTD